eukprot:364947-Chlamydomonas_euryale.AAC.7
MHSTYNIQIYSPSSKQAGARASGADRRAAARVCSDSLPSFPHPGMHCFGATQLSVFLRTSVNASELRKLGSRGQ